MSNLHLSPRQVEVCALTYADESPKQVGRELGITPRMVRQHMEDAALRIRRAFPHLQGADRDVICLWYRECRTAAYFSDRHAA